MIFRKDKWEFVQIGDIVAELRDTVSNPIEAGYDNYIGFEHIEPENLYVNQYGDLKDGITFKKTFKTGDVLFGKIRAYLKKVAIAQKDGICSGDILVLSTKNEKKLIQDLLPYFLTTESFLKQAINSSIGTTLPRTKWQHLSKHKISLPPVDEQKQIVFLFQNIEKSIKHLSIQLEWLKTLWLKLVDDFVNEKPSIGDLLKGQRLLSVNFSDVTEKLMRKIDPIKYGIERIVAGENLETEDFKIRTWGIIGKESLGPAFHVLFKPGDILYGSRRTYLKKVALADFEGVCANTTYVIRANEDILLQNLLKHIMISTLFTQYSIGVSKGSTNPYINWKDLDDFSFQIPDIQTQSEIVKVLDGILDIIEQHKKQKAALINLKQNLLNEILG